MMLLAIEEIRKILVHRYPFLLIDRIDEIEPGKRAVGTKNVTMNEPFFEGHFPGNPVMPGSLILEAMAQVGGVAILYPEDKRGTLAYTTGIDRVKFSRNVVPGDQLRMVAEVIRMRSNMGKIWAQAFVNDEVVAEGEFLFVLSND